MRLSVKVVPRQTGFVARCEALDIVAQGLTRHEVIENLCDVLVSHFRFARDKGNYDGVFDIKEEDHK